MKLDSSFLNSSGMISLEFSLLVLGILASLMMMAFAGKVNDASGRVADASSEAARAASVLQSPDDARTAATSRAEAFLDGVCEDSNIETDTQNFQPGGIVSVKVKCRVSLDYLTLLNIPGEITFSHTSREVIDRYRSG